MTLPEFSPEWIQRFWDRLDRSGGDDSCWPFIGATSSGYGAMKIGGRKGKLIRAHVIAFTIASGCPPVQCVLHTCDNRRCANPRHLFEGTQADNAKDRVARNRARTRPQIGMNNPANVLSEDQVSAIRHRYQTENISQRALASEYGVSQTSVWRIVHLHLWKHVA